MFYNHYFGGMHFIWWAVWIMLLFWIFALPYNIPFQRTPKESLLEILQRRFVLGEITNEEYLEKKKILENDLAKVK